MPSRERLARINLHHVSFGVDKFSAKLDLVDSCGSTGRPIIISRRESRLETIGQTSRTSFASRTLCEFPRSSSFSKTGSLLRFHHRALDATSG